MIAHNKEERHIIAMFDYSLPNASTDLSGQVTLVIGATSGLGLGLARVLASQGAKIAISGRRIERLEALKAFIEKDSGTAFVAPVDMKEAYAIMRMV